MDTSLVCDNGIKTTRTGVIIITAIKPYKDVRLYFEKFGKLQVESRLSYGF